MPSKTPARYITRKLDPPEGRWRLAVVDTLYDEVICACAKRTDARYITELMELGGSTINRAVDAAEKRRQQDAV